MKPKSEHVARRPEDRCETGVRASRANPRESVTDERAVDAIEASDVGNGAQCDEIEECGEIRLGAARESAARAKQCACGDQHVEHHADAREMLARECAPRLAGVDDHGRSRQRRAGKMVVGDQHVEPSRRGRRHAGMACDPVVDGDEDARRHPRRFGDDLGGEAVSVFESIRHEEADVRPECREPAHADRARRRAVRIVVGDDHDPLVRGDRIRETRRGCIDPFHRRERRQRGELPGKIRRGGHATRRQNAR